MACNARFRISNRYFVFLYLTLKNDEMQNIIPKYFPPKAGDINSPNLLVSVGFDNMTSCSVSVQKKSVSVQQKLKP